MTERSPQDQDKYVLRFPDGMRDRLKEAARANNRSMNAEIIDRLEATLDPDIGRILYNVGVSEGVTRGAISTLLDEIKALRFELASYHFNQGRSAPEKPE